MIAKRSSLLSRLIEITRRKLPGLPIIAWAHLIVATSWAGAVHAQADIYRPPEKWVCQWSEGSIPDFGCTGRIGLMRLSRSNFTDQPHNRKEAVRILFGGEEFPAVGSEVTIKRSAHLRGYYWPDRDDQFIRSNEEICNRVGCYGTTKPQGSCALSVGENSALAREARGGKGKLIKCPGPTERTDYFSASTVVKILGYQQMGAFFVLVQIVKIESTNPEADEKKYQFDRKEVI